MRYCSIRLGFWSLHSWVGQAQPHPPLTKGVQTSMDATFKHRVFVGSSSIVLERQVVIAGYRLFIAPVVFILSGPPSPTLPTNYDIFREELATKYSTYGHALCESSPGELILWLKSGTLVSFAKAVSTGCLIFYYLKMIYPIDMMSRNVMNHWYLGQDRLLLLARSSPMTSIQMGSWTALRNVDVGPESNRVTHLTISFIIDDSMIPHKHGETAQVSFSCSSRWGAIPLLPMVCGVWFTNKSRECHSGHWMTVGVIRREHGLTLLYVLEGGRTSV